MEMSTDETEDIGFSRVLDESLDGWEDCAKILRRRSEQKATEADHAGAGMDVGQLDILSLLEKMDGVTYDASPGEALDEKLVQKARAIEM